jgi:hypothetical protein
MHRLVISVSLPVGALMLTYFFSTEDLYPIDTLVHVLDIEMLHIPITTRQGDGQAVCLVRAIKRFAQVGQEGHIVVKITLTDSTFRCHWVFPEIINIHTETLETKREYRTNQDHGAWTWTVLTPSPPVLSSQPLSTSHPRLPSPAALE